MSTIGAGPAAGDARTPPRRIAAPGPGPSLHNVQQESQARHRSQNRHGQCGSPLREERLKERLVVPGPPVQQPMGAIAPIRHNGEPFRQESASSSHKP